MARDNFTQAVIDKLRKRVAHRCSNPDCRVPTIGPAIDPNKVTSIGVAAHITAAAAVGGPRYDFSHPKKPENPWKIEYGFVLIAQTRSIEMLKQWKLSAEILAKQELSKKLPHNNDAIDTLTSALSGQSKKLIPAAISNIHNATTNVLEALDPRFRVKSTFSDGLTQLGIFAKQDVSVIMN